MLVAGWLVGWFTFVGNVFIAVLIVVAVYIGFTLWSIKAGVTFFEAKVAELKKDHFIHLELKCAINQQSCSLFMPNMQGLAATRLRSKVIGLVV